MGVEGSYWIYLSLTLLTHLSDNTRNFGARRSEGQARSKWRGAKSSMVSILGQKDHAVHFDRLAQKWRGGRGGIIPNCATRNSHLIQAPLSTLVTRVAPPPRAANTLLYHILSPLIRAYGLKREKNLKLD